MSLGEWQSAEGRTWAGAAVVVQTSEQGPSLQLEVQVGKTSVETSGLPQLPGPLTFDLLPAGVA